MIISRLILILMVWFSVASCSGGNPQDYSNAAKESCSCVENLASKSENQNKSFTYFYALCTQEVEEKYQVEIESKEFEKALEKDCKNLLEIHIKSIGSKIEL